MENKSIDTYNLNRITSYNVCYTKLLRFKRTDKAYELGQKGMELFERMPDKKHWSQAFYIFNVGLRVWKEPITIILEDFLVCFEKSREGGVITSYSIHYTKLYDKDWRNPRQ